MKVEIDGKTYCVETLIFDNKRLRKEVIESVKSHRLILDMIRAEIKDLDIFYDNDYFSSNRDAMFKCRDVLQIIDKYKAGSEDIK